jgi:hypothetical protein
MIEQKNIYFTIYSKDEDDNLTYSTQVVNSIEDASNAAIVLWENWRISSLVSVGTDYKNSEAVFYTGEENNG